MHKKENAISARNWIVIWLVGLAGQLCWNVENQWFNTFVYAKIGPDASIIAWMTGVSAAMTTISTFLFGTWSDRIGRRRPFISIGYILWGIFTILFGATEFLPASPVILAAVMVVAMDALMSFFGSMGNDSGFNSWTTDITNEHNRGQLGAAVAAQPVLATIVGTVGGGMVIEHFGYFAFFIFMGVFVLLVGVFGTLMMREGAGLKPLRDEKGFWHQLFALFNFKTFVRNKELFCVFFVMTAYFICFNFFFVHIGNYFIYTLGFSEGDAGVIQGVGLILAVLATIPAARFINRGRHALMILAAVISSVIGLTVVGFSGSALVPVVIGIILVGVGYVLMLQTTTAWVKNLYPEGQRGQFEGIRLIFFVLIPMVIGPAVASMIIKRWGVPVTIDGAAGMAPSSALFFWAAGMSVLTLIPLYFARRERRRSAAAGGN
ncbi:MAG: MFS transporter [Clostridia bacterium]|nr:MFS transporter [Clostridia bacterium]